MPVAGRDLREEAEDRVADVAVARYQLPGAAGEESVRLRVVELVPHDRQRQQLELVGIHLVVAGHHGRCVHPLGERALVAGDDRGADTAVAVVGDHLDAWILDRARALRGRVGRGVVDHVDPIDETGNALERGPDQAFFVVSRHDDGHLLAFEHAPLFSTAAALPPTID